MRLSSSYVGLSHAAVDVLRYLKARHDYRSLSSMLGISPSTLSRYISGKAMPRARNAKKILEKSLDIVNPVEVVREYFGLEPDIENGVYLFHDVQTVKILASYAMSEFMGSKITNALALDMLALPLATCFAALVSCNIYFASEKPIWRDGRYVEISYKPDSMGGKEKVWIPIEAAASRASSVIFMTRLFNTGLLKETLRVMEKRGALAAGLFVLVTRRKIWEALSTSSGCRRIALLVYD